MNEFQFAGAKWWKFDFHTHTPASDDFGDKNMTHESWLRAFMDAGIYCVAITDHNSGGWIDDLKKALKDIKSKNPDWYKPLYLFPGVEISADGNVHILAIFGCDKDKSHIDELIGAIDYQGTKGDTNGVTRKSIIDVVDEIAKRGGIPIPAHADTKKGLFKLEGQTLENILKNEKIYAMELRDSNYQKPQLYIDKKLQWTEIIGSDVHDFSQETFGTFTWVKMDEPSIEGLKLALQDGDVSVNRNINDTPNKPPEYFIKSLEISKTKYIGRSKPLNCRFSPFLNTIIGGRGTGKSTLLEFMRLVLQRGNDIKGIPVPLKNEIRRYFDVGGDNLLLENSKISLIYRKGEVQYRLNCPHNSDCPSFEEQKDDGTWKSFDGDVQSLLPVRIYSQKQIYELAKNPSALIEIIDEAPKVEAEKSKTETRDLVNRYKQIEGKRRELNDKIAEETRLRGEFNDHTRQIEQIEKSGHKEILQNYRERQQQLNELESLERKWEEMLDQLLKTQDAIAPADFNTQHFSEHTDILSTLGTTNENWQSIHDRLSELVQKASSIITEWQTEKNTADWMQALKTDRAQYERLRSEFEQQGIDPDRYPLLLAQQKHRQNELNSINEHKVSLHKLGNEKQKVFVEIKENRKILSEKRQEFLTSVLQGNQFVSIQVQPFGESWDTIEKEIRRILQCPNRFDKDFDSLKAIYKQEEGDKIHKLKEIIKAIRNGKREAEHKAFANHLEKLTSESIIDLTLWFPGDALKITLLSTNGRPNKPLESGSQGERAAALLAFILSYGDEPLLLDQPEDDLDNELIYDLIVKQLRDRKSKRQIIVVTHNANIVVNGDAEMVFPLHVVRTETRVKKAASIQEKEVRDAICKILEGGEKAFEQRYKRIHLGD
ncbi:ABC transporter [Candidatus Poribacteria bacterium]|nr:ABC transporter [Candidatus Poribacteria bacterium]